jgi:hypothetical protein
VLNTPFGSWIPDSPNTSTNASTNSVERLRSRNASKRVKRVFDLEIGPTSSTTGSFTASVAFKSKIPSRTRARTRRNHRDAEQPVASTGSSAPTPDAKLASELNPPFGMKKNHSGQDDNVLQATDAIVQRLEKFSIANGNQPSGADCEANLSSRNSPPVRWLKEGLDAVIYDMLSPSNWSKIPNSSLYQA